MIVTMLEAHVDADREADLVAAFGAATTDLPPFVLEVFLLHSNDPDVWRMVTVWRSQEEWDAYWDAMGPPRGIQTFGAIGVVPDLAIFDVAAHASQ